MAENTNKSKTVNLSNTLGSPATITIDNRKVDTSLDAIKNLLKSTTATDEEKIEYLINNQSEFSAIVRSLQNYENKMSKIGITGREGASLNYNLYNRLKSIVEETDYNKFKISMDIVMLFFRFYQDSSFGELKIHRFASDWKSGDKEFKCYQYLSTMCCMLCDPSTRASEIKRIDITKVFNKDKTGLSTSVSINLSRYFEQWTSKDKK